MSKKKITLLTLVILVAFGAVLMSGCSAKSEVTADMNQEIKSAVSADEESGETENQVPVADAHAEEKSTEQNESNPALSGPDADGDGLPDDVEKTYGTNPYTPDSDGDGQNDLQDQQPTTTDVTISETSTAALPVSFVDLRVENNATADHLEMTLKNTGNAALDEFDIYYLITDKLNGVTESYYVKLDGLTILPGEKKTIHFDNEIDKEGHYYGNPYGLYGTSANGLIFNIKLHNSGYQSIEKRVDKDPGVEVPD